MVDVMEGCFGGMVCVGGRVGKSSPGGAFPCVFGVGGSLGRSVRGVESGFRFRVGVLGGGMESSPWLVSSNSCEKNWGPFGTRAMGLCLTALAAILVEDFSFPMVEGRRGGWERVGVLVAFIWFCFGIVLF